MKYPGRIIFTFAGLMLLGLLAVLFMRQPAPEDTGYIFDRTTGPAIEQIMASKEQIAAVKAHEQTIQDNGKAQISDDKIGKEAFAIKDLFSQMIVGSGTTLRYFSWLGHEFRKATSREEHLAQVKARIFSQFPPEEASRLFETYKQYLDCEIAVADLTADFGAVTSAEEGLALLREVQEFRRDFLGRELADRLFGERIKEKEYSVRRGAIINDRTLYAEEKQEQLDRLAQDMWGDSDALERSFHNANAYTRYRDALDMHQKDMDEITTEADRQAYIDDIRNQHLPLEAVERIKALEQQQAKQQQQEQAYFAAEKRITEDTTLSEDDKAEKIESLRQEMLGNQAEAMKRRETIEAVRKTRIEQFGSAPDSGP